MIHYFAYRASSKKSGRFFIPQFSIERFILFSNRIGEVVSNPGARADEYAVLSDDQGRSRLYIAFGGYTIVAFKDGLDKPAKIITVIPDDGQPGSTLKKAQKDLEGSKYGKEGQRLNQLNGEISITHPN